MVGSLLRAALVDSGHQEASMDASGPNGQPFEPRTAAFELGLKACASVR